MQTIVYRKWYDARNIPGAGRFGNEISSVSEKDFYVDTIWPLGEHENPSGYRIEYTNGTEYVIPYHEVMAILDDGVDDED